MHTARLNGYIDRGSIEQFAGQIAAEIEGSTAIALRSVDGEVLWASGSDRDLRFFRGTPDLQQPDAHRKALGSGRHLYDFKLRAQDDEVVVLGLVVDRIDPPGAAAVFDAIKPVLECVERQFAVSATLTMRAPVFAARDDPSLATKILELRPRASFAASLEALAALCREGLACEVAAILLPDHELRALAPSSASDDRKLFALLGRLLARAKTTRRMLISEMPPGIGSAGGGRVLSSPVIDPSDRVVGVFAATGGSFGKEHARLARAICNKVTLLSQQFNLGSREFMTRNEFIDFIDGNLLRDANTEHSVLYFDANKMHLINDSFGYKAGDKAIETIGGLIRDAGLDHVVAHLMGDRFALLLRNTGSEDACARAEHILDLLGRESIEQEGKTLQLSASVGIATAPTVARNGAELLTIAEVASRGAKERGGSQCAVFRALDESMVQRRSDADQIGYLQMALIENRFSLYAQEIRSLYGRKAKKYEVLVRLAADRGAPLSPHKFLPAAERYQMMAALDRWVINQTLKLIAEATSTLDVTLATFCINISPQSLREADFIEHIERGIAETGVPPDTLCFELTETAMVRNLDQAHHFISRLQKQGCRVALDDFGTGYSSFAYLKNLPVQYLKIDGVFVRDLLESPLSEAIVSAVVKIGEVMGAATVAEHVEGELVVQKLRALGVDYMQGFHVHRPQPLAEVLAELDRPDPELAEFLEDVAAL